MQRFEKFEEAKKVASEGEKKGLVLSVKIETDGEGRKELRIGACGCDDLTEEVFCYDEDNNYYVRGVEGEAYEDCDEYNTSHIYINYFDTYDEAVEMAKEIIEKVKENREKVREGRKEEIYYIVV